MCTLTRPPPSDRLYRALASRILVLNLTFCHSLFPLHPSLTQSLQCRILIPFTQPWQHAWPLVSVITSLLQSLYHSQVVFLISIYPLWGNTSTNPHPTAPRQS